MTPETATILAAIIGAAGVILAALVPYLVGRSRAQSHAAPQDRLPLPSAEQPDAQAGNLSPFMSGTVLTFTLKEGETRFIGEIGLTICLTGIGDLGFSISMALPAQETRWVSWYTGTIVQFSAGDRHYVLACKSISRRLQRVTFEIRHVGSA